MFSQAIAVNGTRRLIAFGDNSVNIAISQKDILVDAHLRLKSDVSYGLVGRNGQGKSSESG